MRQPSKLAIAMHEAGHAVIRATTAGAPPVQLVTLTDLADGELGRTVCLAQWQPMVMEQSTPSSEELAAWSKYAWQDVIFYLAGPISELRWRRNSRAAIWFAGPDMAERCFADEPPEEGSDFGRVRRRLAWLHPGDERAAFNRAWLEAEDRVAKLLTTIQWVGMSLFECEELSGCEVVDFIDAVPRDRASDLSPRHQREVLPRF